MKSEQAHEIARSSVQASLPETLRRVILSTGVQPLTSVEAVVTDAASNVKLQESYEEQLKDDVKHKLSRDPSYCPSKFPNSDKYYKSDQ